MRENVRKNIELGVLFGLICAITLSFARFEVRCDELRQNVLRLHIIANSDEVADQTLKLAVRDKILESTSEIFENCKELSAAEAAAQQNLDLITNIAQEVISENGVLYGARASVGDSYFGTREYDDFTLPAGTYRSLIVTLGEGKGKNWWCVVFPSVCLPSAADKAELSDSVSKESAKVAENPQKYVMKFKTAEIYEEIRQYFTRNNKK